jgi:hypothetical protein
VVFVVWVCGRGRGRGRGCVCGCVSLSFSLSLSVSNGDSYVWFNDINSSHVGVIDCTVDTSSIAAAVAVASGSDASTVPAPQDTLRIFTVKPSAGNVASAMRMC